MTLPIGVWQEQMVQMKNRISGLLMETGVSYNKQRLHKLGYFTELISGNEEVDESIRPLLKLSRETIVSIAAVGLCPGQFAGTRSAAGRAAEAVEDDSWGRANYCTDLGS
jgi:hypothetical protein